MNMNEIKARIDAVVRRDGDPHFVNRLVVAQLMREAYLEGQRDARAKAQQTTALEEFERGEQSGRANLQVQLRELLGLHAELETLHRLERAVARLDDLP